MPADLRFRRRRDRLYRRGRRAPDAPDPRLRLEPPGELGLDLVGARSHGGRPAGDRARQSRPRRKRQAARSRRPIDPKIMAEDARRLLDHLGIERADVIGYSMGARIAAYLALAHPERVRRAVFSGLGDGMVKGVGAPEPIAAALRADFRRRGRGPRTRAPFASSPSRRKATARRSPPASSARACS